MNDELKGALVQLRAALKACERDGSALVSVPLSPKEIGALLAQERERCARVADEFNNEQNGPVAAAISRAIRAE